MRKFYGSLGNLIDKINDNGFRTEKVSLELLYLRIISLVL